ncbi:MAG TPA: helix-turn-helix transcriptional regulator, partial [Chloroflexia bacterium]|nr:helix-turn-helix transcriptional regulator [Chloroflexia bacterium]
MDRLDTAGGRGAWLRQQRRAQDLTQEALAARAGCSVASIQKIEAGTVPGSPRLVAQLQAALAAPPAAGGPPPPGAWGSEPFGAFLRRQRA